jgi:hypothetical protein
LSAGRHGRPASCSPPSCYEPASDFGPPGFPPILSRENAELTVALLADSELVDGVGNHLTFVFGDGARVLGHMARFFAEVPPPGARTRSGR